MLLLLGSPDCRRDYHAGQLDTDDARRLQAAPPLALRADWQSSRVLKQRARQHALPVRSLSHSRGAAALCCGHEVAGIDLEALRPRDFAALLASCARPAEIGWWQRQPDALRAFYRLWTCKEALIKAAGLDFPADLHRCGLWPHPAGGWQPGIGQHDGTVIYWSGWQTEITPGWMLACVWLPNAAPLPPIYWQTLGQGPWQLPPMAGGRPLLPWPLPD